MAKHVHDTNAKFGVLITNVGCRYNPALWLRLASDCCSRSWRQIKAVCSHRAPGGVLVHFSGDPPHKQRKRFLDTITATGARLAGAHPDGPVCAIVSAHPDLSATTAVLVAPPSSWPNPDAFYVAEDSILHVHRLRKRSQHAQNVNGDHAHGEPSNYCLAYCSSPDEAATLIAKGHTRLTDGTTISVERPHQALKPKHLRSGPPLELDEAKQPAAGNIAAVAAPAPKTAPLQATATRAIAASAPTSSWAHHAASEPIGHRKPSVILEQLTNVNIFLKRTVSTASAWAPPAALNLLHSMQLIGEVVRNLIAALAQSAPTGAAQPDVLPAAPSSLRPGSPNVPSSAMAVSTSNATGRPQVPSDHSESKGNHCAQPSDATSRRPDPQSVSEEQAQQPRVQQQQQQRQQSPPQPTPPPQEQPVPTGAAQSNALLATPTFSRPGSLGGSRNTVDVSSPDAMGRSQASGVDSEIKESDRAQSSAAAPQPDCPPDLQQQQAQQQQEQQQPPPSPPQPGPAEPDTLLAAPTSLRPGSPGGSRNDVGVSSLLRMPLQQHPHQSSHQQSHERRQPSPSTPAAAHDSIGGSRNAEHVPPPTTGKPQQPPRLGRNETARGLQPQAPRSDRPAPRTAPRSPQDQHQQLPEQHLPGSPPAAAQQQELQTEPLPHGQPQTSSSINRSRRPEPIELASSAAERPRLTARSPVPHAETLAASASAADHALPHLRQLPFYEQSTLLPSRPTAELISQHVSLRRHQRSPRWLLPLPSSPAPDSAAAGSAFRLYRTPPQEAAPCPTVRGPQPPPSQDDEQTDCHYCGESTPRRDFSNISPCGHEIHTPCGLHWAENSSTCPTCCREMRRIGPTPVQQRRQPMPPGATEGDAALARQLAEEPESLHPAPAPRGRSPSPDAPR